MSKLTSKCCNAEVKLNRRTDDKNVILKEYYVCTKCWNNCEIEKVKNLCSNCNPLNSNGVVHCHGTGPQCECGCKLTCPDCGKEMTRVRGGGMECFNDHEKQNKDCIEGKCDHLSNTPEPPYRVKEVAITDENIRNAVNNLKKEKLCPCLDCTNGTPCYGENWGCDCKCKEQKRPECSKYQSSIDTNKFYKIKALKLGYRGDIPCSNCAVMAYKIAIDEVLAILNEK